MEADPYGEIDNQIILLKIKLNLNILKLMDFLGVVPARSNSSSLKKKNTFLLNNKPLIQYTFEALQNSLIKKKYLLTDDNKIKKIAKKFKILTEYPRPKKVSKSTTSLADTLFHFHNWATNQKIFYDYMVVLQPTSPLRDYIDINNSIKIIRKKKYKSLFSISKSLEHPYETIKFIKKNKWKHVLEKSKLYHRRQDFDFESYFINGAIYIISRELVIKRKIYDKKNHGFFIMPKQKSIDINDLSEIEIAKYLLRKK